MLHLLASLVTLLLLGAAGALVVRMIEGERERITAALLRQAPRPAARPWASRVRVTATSRPALLRAAPRRAAA